MVRGDEHGNMSGVGKRLPLSSWGTRQRYSSEMGAERLKKETRSGKKNLRPGELQASLNDGQGRGSFPRGPWLGHLCEEKNSCGKKEGPVSKKKRTIGRNDGAHALKGGTGRLLGARRTRVMKAVIKRTKKGLMMIDGRVQRILKKKENRGQPAFMPRNQKGGDEERQRKPSICSDGELGG